MRLILNTSLIKVGFDDYERNSHSFSLVALYDVRQQQGAVDSNRSSLLLLYARHEHCLTGASPE